MNHCTFIPTGDSSGAFSFSELSSCSSTTFRSRSFEVPPLRLTATTCVVFLLSPGCRGTSVDVWPSTRAASFHGFVACSIHLRRIRDPWLLFSWRKKPRVTDLSVIRVGVHGALSGKSESHFETTGEHLHSTHHWIQVVFSTVKYITVK